MWLLFISFPIRNHPQLPLAGTGMRQTNASALRRINPYIYEFATEIEKIRNITEFWCILDITEKNKLFNVCPEAAHALIGIKLNRQMSSMHQQISAKFHPVGRHLAEWRPKNLFLTYNRGRPLPMGDGRQ